MNIKEEINLLTRAAEEAFQILRQIGFKKRAELMDIIADEIEALGDELIQTAHEETHLPEGRLTGEKGRTVGQWRNYGRGLSAGEILMPIIDTAQPDRTPPKPDLRKTYIGLGPVVVFGASNFPFAFSTAGGDTASALAAGCPVIVKAHPAHPKTAKIMGDAIKRGVEKAGFHSGTFAQIFDSSFDAGQLLVTHPLIKAVGFTGSFAGGKALFDLAQQRNIPIPVFAEMGSVNPVVILPEILKEKRAEIANQYIASLNLGVGQFCTNPGLLVLPEKEDEFVKLLIEEAQKTTPGKMLHQGISEAYSKKKKELISKKEVKLLHPSQDTKTGWGSVSLAQTSAEEFASNPALQEEIFGPFGLVITYKDKHELLEIFNRLSGQLTATLWGSEEEAKENVDLVSVMTEKSGRVLYNGFPTGVEVTRAMQHGGPFPASTDSRFTSVGADAILRFARPVSYQNMPDELLPGELKNSNPSEIMRMVNGKPSRLPL